MSNESSNKWRSAFRLAFRLSGVCLYGSVLPLLLPAEAWSADHERWVPSLGFNFGIEFQDASASGATSDILGPPVDPEVPGLPVNNPLSPPSSGETGVSIPSLSGVFELMSPSLFDGWVRPRLFGRIGVGVDLAATIRPAASGDPSPMAPPPNVNFFRENDIVGQGNEAELAVKPLEVTASMGIAFEREFEGRAIRVKPSVELIRRTFEASGAVNRAVQIAGGLNITSLSSVRLEELRTQNEETFYGIGPGLEVEFDAIRRGPIIISAYAGAAAYHYLGDLEFGIAATNEFGESANFDFEVDEWSFRGNVGFRFRWSPE